MRSAITSRCVLGESPLWDTRIAAFVWVDIRGAGVHRWDPETGDHLFVPAPFALVPGIVTGDGLDDYIVATSEGILKFRFGIGFGEVLAHPLAGRADHRYNEIKRDAEGRIWIGTMQDVGATATGELLVQTDSGYAKVLAGIRIPNSLCWPGQNGILTFSDSRTGELGLWRLAAGRLERTGTLLSAGGFAGEPDGVAADSEGHVWNARFGGSAVIRLAPDGAISAVVRLPVTQVTSCCLGGPEGRTLFITTSTRLLSPDALNAQLQAGDCFVAEVDVPATD